MSATGPMSTTTTAAMTMPALRVGEGWDVHALVAGRPLILGGVTIPHDRGLLGHSDADALLHAITDALFGAAALGDIGRHFSDTDAQFKGADSAVLLAEARDFAAGTSSRSCCRVMRAGTTTTRVPPSRMIPMVVRRRALRRT